MKELEKSQESLYVLEEDTDSSLYFTVTCGGVAMYDVQIQLNEDERQQYVQHGRSYLDQLAASIGRNSAAYRHRFVTR